MPQLLICLWFVNRYWCRNAKSRNKLFYLNMPGRRFPSTILRSSRVGNENMLAVRNTAVVKAVKTFLQVFLIQCFSNRAGNYSMNPIKNSIPSLSAY